ncbi:MULTISPECIES: multicopper oxidase family protein [Catenuloplanes]|uniref:Multicopper oxidase CueO n=1 Tax=Catenuloplanes niger TaxID=587534 RepID=A0AAE4CTD8_9ACTN|nr:multicopper oxidase family protein [Catenuloplanes niger]MDR7325196.1 FtsP/CotA-like multicopper oxidase with cupredoxin domain [Catenuloplanes niger]
MFNRRQLLALGTAAATGAVAASLSKANAPAANAAAPAATDHAAHLGAAGEFAPRAAASGPVVTPFTQCMPVPPVLAPTSTVGGVDAYTIEVRPADVEIVPGLRTPAYTYAGHFTGPTIRARAGRPATVAFTNRLTTPTNVHLHGGHVAPDSDGHPMDQLAPGAAKVYEYPNTQRAATLWYHDHTHALEADHVYRGLHGFYLIEDPAERRLGLPSGDFDVPVMLRNAELDATGAFVFGGHPDNRTVVMANGKAQPYFPVAPRKYRFRLLNAALKHVFRLSLGGAEMTKIGTDGGLLPAPVPLTEVSISSGERVEVVIDFARWAGRGPVHLYDGDNPIIRFDVAPGRVADPSRVPPTLRPLPPLGTPTVERTVTMSMDMSLRPPIALMNGRPYDPSRADVSVRRGTTEIWNVVNEDLDPAFPFDHPFHMHLMQFRVIGRDGGPPLPEDAGLKDTVYVGPRGSVRLQVTFDTPFTGEYLAHCHFLEHSALGMMLRMDVLP